MVRAWYMDAVEKDPRLEHQKTPPEFITMDELFTITGVEYIHIDVNNPATSEKLHEIKLKRGFNYEDELTCSRECLENYDEKLKWFYHEHLHEDQEIRLILEGSGYFDVRDKDDKWIRIEVVGGDLLILPSGIYHRFTLDQKEYLKAKRFFVGEPVWTPYNRPCDFMECRKHYLQTMH